ncbi:hypothetical protein [Luteimonas sp. R10]|uniref:hypothetical protein n=1 Tax=Luteimonas sp. R10 TaxID=3108176 RepID=UPI00308F56F2|nr:hypothetical protein U3649_03405 [Luteimonas sp. R10]
MEAGFAIARGYKNTIHGALREDENNDRLAKLHDLLVEHLVAGEKMIQFVKLERGEHAKLRTWITGKRKTSNPLTDAFPGVAPVAEIVTCRHQAPSSVGTVDLSSGHAALYTASRSYVERVELPASKLKADAAAGYERLVGYRRVYVQTYEAVWLPPEGNFVCLAIDSPVGVPIQFADASLAALSHQVRSQLGRSLSFYNLWPAVEGLYRSSEGKLVDYGFSVGGRSVNHHKARRRTECLRKAVYDSAGAAAVGDDLQLFKVAIQWALRQTSSLKSEPELLIPGVAADLNRPMATVNHAFLRNSLSSRDLQFISSKLITHMK